VALFLCEATVINSRKIEDLHPYVAKLCKQFVAACKKEGIDVLITSTYRDNESQAAIYAQGRTKPGRIVTNAKAGQSFHNYRLAFDFVPIVNGKAMWNDARSFKRARQIGESLGLEGLSFEMAHLQWTGGLSLAQLRAGKQPVVA
jgi:peptidoglycan L-alanyl-D-glutamate endopeptidase CwlK